jgi:hypothetical protein
MFTCYLSARHISVPCECSACIHHWKISTWLTTSYSYWFSTFFFLNYIIVYVQLHSFLLNKTSVIIEIMLLYFQSMSLIRILHVFTVFSGNECWDIYKFDTNERVGIFLAWRSVQHLVSFGVGPHSSSPKNIEYVTPCKPFYPHFFKWPWLALENIKFLLTLLLYRLMIKQLN